LFLALFDKLVESVLLKGFRNGLATHLGHAERQEAKSRCERPCYDEGHMVRSPLNLPLVSRNCACFAADAAFCEWEIILERKCSASNSITQLAICAENQVHLSDIVFISQKKETWPVRSKRRIKTQTVLPSAETAAMLFWALLASGQISMRKVDGWQTLATKPLDQPFDLAA
jgi:hypothetical protein